MKDSGSEQEEAGGPADCRTTAEQTEEGKGAGRACTGAHSKKAQPGLWGSWSPRRWVEELGSPRNSLSSPPCCAQYLSGSSPGKQMLLRENAGVGPGHRSWCCLSIELPTLVQIHSLHSCSLTGQPWEIHSSSLNLTFSIFRIGW